MYLPNGPRPRHVQAVTRAVGALEVGAAAFQSVRIAWTNVADGGDAGLAPGPFVDSKNSENTVSWPASIARPRHGRTASRLQRRNGPG
jgi:hypothetical protein